MLVWGASYPYKQLLLSYPKTAEKSLQDTSTGKLTFFEKQEVVQVSLDDAVQYPALEQTAVISTSFEPAVRITAHGFQIEITNAAAEETVFCALSALQRLC